VTQNNPGTNPPAPGGTYGDTNDYFIFTPDTNYPWIGQTRTVQSMFVGNSVLVFGSGATAVYLWQNYYALWATKALAAYTAYYNQTVPADGAVPADISMGDFKSQENP
jgi:hypothetical protein